MRTDLFRGLMVLAASAYLMVADFNTSAGFHFYKNGYVKEGADFTRRGNELRPGNVHYAVKRCGSIEGLAPFAGPARRRDFAKRMLRISAGVVRRHPRYAAAYELMASSELWAANFLGRDLARAAARSSKTALELYPFDIFAAEKLAAASFIIGDIEQAEKALALVERIRGFKK